MKLWNKRALLVCIALTAFVLAACGSEDIQLVPLSQSITTSDGLLTVSYPETWAVQEANFQLFFANSEEALSVPTREIGAGQIQGTVNVLTDNSLSVLNLTTGARPRQVLDRFISLTGRESPISLNINNRDDFRANGRNAVIATGTANDDGNRYGVIFLLIRVDGGYGFLSFATPENQTGQYISELRSMAASIQYRPVTPP